MEILDCFSHRFTIKTVVGSQRSKDSLSHYYVEKFKNDQINNTGTTNLSHHHHHQLPPPISSFFFQ